LWRGDLNWFRQSKNREKYLEGVRPKCSQALPRGEESGQSLLVHPEKIDLFVWVIRDKRFSIGEKVKTSVRGGEEKREMCCGSTEGGKTECSLGGHAVLFGNCGRKASVNYPSI